MQKQLKEGRPAVPVSTKLDQHVASVVSLLADPKIVFFALFAYVAAVEHRSIGETSFLLLYVAGALVLLRSLRRRARSEDSFDFRDPYHQKVRYCTLTLHSLLCVAFGLFSLAHGGGSWGASTEAMFFFVSGIVTVVILAITWALRFKMSAHVGFLGLVLQFLLPGGMLKYVVFLALGLLVGWARVRLRNHSVKQIAVTGMLVFIVYWVWDMSH